MSELVTRDVAYEHDGTRMLGLVCAPASPAPDAPAVLLVHDAFGLGPEMTANAERLARAGHPVFLADVWGGRTTPASVDEIGPLIGGLAGDRPRWLARLAAAHAALRAQPGYDARPVVVLGYCFGGSSALEYLRSGADVAGVVAIHPGLDLLEHDWSAAGTAPVLVCVGADDPMATAEMRLELQSAMDGAGLDWQLQLYSGTTHAFTSRNAADSPQPELFAFHPRSAARAWRATEDFLTETRAPLTTR